jgi:hypothetical protein
MCLAHHSYCWTVFFSFVARLRSSHSEHSSWIVTFDARRGGGLLPLAIWARRRLRVACVLERTGDREVLATASSAVVDAHLPRVVAFAANAAAHRALRSDRSCHDFLLLWSEQGTLTATADVNGTSVCSANRAAWSLGATTCNCFSGRADGAEYGAESRSGKCITHVVAGFDVAGPPDSKEVRGVRC